MGTQTFHQIQMKVIGIAGGIASGKSFVSELFEQLGAKSLNADEIGHLVLCEEHVKSSIREHFGESVFDSDGEVNRSRLGKVVFANGNSQQLKKLESITHPQIRKHIEKRIDSYRKENVPAVILDAPVMFKTGWSSICDKIVFVNANEETRLKRALKRGWTKSEYLQRQSQQTSIEEKRNRSDFVLDNDQSKQHTFSQIKTIWNQIIHQTLE